MPSQLLQKLGLEDYKFKVSLGFFVRKWLFNKYLKSAGRWGYRVENGGAGVRSHSLKGFNKTERASRKGPVS